MYTPDAEESSATPAAQLGKPRTASAQHSRRMRCWGSYDVENGVRSFMRELCTVIRQGQNDEISRAHHQDSFLARKAKYGQVEALGLLNKASKPDCRHGTPSCSYTPVPAC